MNKYEALYILDGALNDEGRASEVEKFVAAVVENGGTEVNVDKWGMKKLAYPINFKNEGYYVLMTFCCPPSVPAELERRMRIDDSVLRFLVIKK